MVHPGNALCAFAIALAAVGCAVQPGGKAAPATAARSCPGASCELAVWVTGSGDSLKVNVEADEIRVERGNRDPNIVWKLRDSPRYEFRRDAITANTEPPRPGKGSTSRAAWDDQCTYVRHSPVEFVIRNRNSAQVRLYYDITVYDKATGTAYKLDPVIFNDGP